MSIELVIESKLVGSELIMLRTIMNDTPLYNYNRRCLLFKQFCLFMN